jgi:hypothetical protein
MEYPHVVLEAEKETQESRSQPKAGDQRSSQQ